MREIFITAWKTVTHLLVKVDGVAQEGGVMDEAEACPALWHFGPEQQLLVQLHADVAAVKHPGVPQAVHHDDDVVVELAVRLPADVKGLLQGLITGKIDMWM